MFSSKRHMPLQLLKGILLQPTLCDSSSTFADDNINWSCGLHAVSSVRVGLDHISDVVRRLAVMSRRNEFALIIPGSSR
jgi:hypothetical protein